MTSVSRPVLLAWSGGKDSTLALGALAAASTPVAGLLTTITAEYDRISMHGVRTSLLRAQARSLGIPLTTVEIEPAASNDSYEMRMALALERARAEGLRSVAFGDLYLEDVRRYRERMLAAVEMTALFPLWGLPTGPLARDFLARGYRAIIVCVDTEQAPADLVGRDFDARFLDDLPDGVDPCGENGEFHTFVHDGPLFREPVSCVRGETVLRGGRFMYQELL
ncbi:MAG: ATP-binding protein [Gemmatimonadota bacterium]